MNNKFIRFVALFVCILMLMSSFAMISAFADETEEENKEKTWEDKWKEDLQPAYINNGFSSVKDRILASGSPAIEPMVLYAVIDGYAFYGDKYTGEMIFLVLKNKELTKADIEKNGSIPEYSAFYCTNPYNAGQAQGIGSEGASIPKVKEQLMSQLIISFTDAEEIQHELNSFTDGAAYNQIAIKNIRNGVRVEYTIGREQVKYLVPRIIRKEKLEALYEQIRTNSDKRTAEVFKAYYMLKDLNDPNNSETVRKQIKEQFPITEKFAIYVTNGVIEGSDELGTRDILRIESLIKSYTDYDYDSLDADHAEAEYEVSDKAPPLFKLALEYRVSGKEITVRCNAGNIRFDSSAYSLSNVQVLPFGGAGDVNNSGYLFTPDGSGSLIKFDDLKNYGNKYYMPSSLYGQDYAYHTISGANQEVSRLPVFGVYQSVANDHEEMVDVEVRDETTGEIKIESVKTKVPLEIAYLAVIEEGASLASVNISYGGLTHNYASIYTSFNPRPKDSYRINAGLSVGSSLTWTIESKRKYTGNFTLRLFILDGAEDGNAGEKSYSDMAAAYRKYLEREGILNKVKDTEEDIPLYLETLGALEITKTFMGFPYDSTISLTSFKDTENILTELREEYGIGNVKVKMSGWYNGGLMGDIATSIKVEGCLGGEDGFKELIAYAKEHNVTLFPDIELSFAYSDNWFDGFDSEEDCAQTIDERSARKQIYDPVWQGFITVTPGEAILSTGFIKELYEKAYSDYSKYEVGAISVGNLGEYLSSDFDPDNSLTREDSKELTTQLLNTIKENNGKVLVNAGNDYVLPYVTDILDMPLDDSRLLISYATVPFMSMVLHGYKEYAGTALNLAGDYDYYILKTIESGAAPYYVVAVDNVAELKELSYSTLEEYYSVRYSTWTDDIVATYNEINEAVKDVQTAIMLNHKILSVDGKVVMVTYDNGITFYINYTSKPFSVEGTDIVVPAKGYIKVNAEKGEGK
ncbi:MAG: hypothetical protein IKU23_02475 [Clostridia bacterium]|nr:hypothetical protein [Clostridia bacterium]